MAPRTARQEDVEVPESDRAGDLTHPRLQAELFGHDSAARQMASAARSGHLHHAWLISGPKGVGKATLAWRFARAILAHGRTNCPDTLHVPPEHVAFRRIVQLAHPDVIVIRRPWDTDRKRFKTELPIAEVRKLRGYFSKHPSDGDTQVAIVDCADDMSTEAQNALLKVLEEPPKAAILLLLSHAPGQLLPTIKSRCRALQLRPLGAEDMTQALQHLAPDVPAPELEVAATLAEGAPGQAAALAMRGSVVLYQELLTLLATLPRLNHGMLHGFAERTVKQFADRTVSEVATLLSQLVERHLRSQMGTIAPMTQERDVFRRMAVAIPGPSWTEFWTDLRNQFVRADALNLDKKQFVLNAFYSIESAVKTRE